LGNFGAHDGKILPDKKQIDQFTESDSEDQNAFQMKVTIDIYILMC